MSLAPRTCLCPCARQFVPSRDRQRYIGDAHRMLAHRRIKAADFSRRTGIPLVECTEKAPDTMA